MCIYINKLINLSKDVYVFKVTEMKIFIKFLVSTALLAFIGSAQAVPTTVNFQTITDGSGSYGESVWSTLSLYTDFGVDVDITGADGSTDAYAYLDYGKAGLGVCRNLNDAGVAKLNQKNPGSGSNLCAPGSDDNVNMGTSGESLTFEFLEDLVVTGIWFNNNHDPDYGMDGDTVVINGINHTFDDGADPSNHTETRDDVDLGWLFDFSTSTVSDTFLTGDTLNIGYYTGSSLRAEEFYISAITFDTVSTVPEPAVLALLGLGLMGIGATKRKKVH